MAATVAEDRQRQEEAKRAHAQGLVAIYREGVPKNHKQAQSLVDLMVSRGLSAHIDIGDDRPSAFVVYRRQWQAAIFDRLYQNDHNQPIRAFDIAEAWSERWAKPGLRKVKSDYARWIVKEIADDFRSPYEEIASYLARLQAVGVVYRTSRGNAYHMHYRFKEDLRAAIEKEGLPARRKGQLLEAFKAVEGLMQPNDGKLEDFDKWLKKRATSSAMRGVTRTPCFSRRRSNSSAPTEARVNRRQMGRHSSPAERGALTPSIERQRWVSAYSPTLRGRAPTRCLDLLSQASRSPHLFGLSGNGESQ